MEKVIRFIINHVPRKIIQLVAHYATRIMSIFYIGNNVECPICRHHYKRFMPYGYKVTRKNALCPHCMSLERHRLLWLYLNNESNLFENSDIHILHLAPEECFIKKLELKFKDNYVTADLESPLAKIKMDIRDIPFPDESFDVIFCNHILEHIDDDRLAMRELYRILRKGGWGIMLSPINYNLQVTREAPENATAKERYALFGQADHMREYGIDYADRLHDTGFDVETIQYAGHLSEEQRLRYGVMDEIIYLVRKTADNK